MFSPFLLCILIALATTAPEERKYTTKYDNINLEDLVRNERLLKAYVDCLLDQGHCTPDGLELKQIMPDAIATDCSGCSQKQKEGADFMIRYFIDNKPEYWERLEQKYDPTGAYRARYLELKMVDEATSATSE